VGGGVGCGCGCGAGCGMRCGMGYAVDCGGTRLAMVTAPPILERTHHMSGAATILATVEELSDVVDDNYERGQMTRIELVEILDAIRQARGILHVLEQEVENEIVEIAHAAGLGNTFDVSSVGRVEIKRRTKRTGWANDDLIRVLTAYALDERKLDEKTGEYEPAHEAVARVLAECARPSWRVTPLRARGLQVDEFCHEEADGYGVQIIR
jgi:hypothetical protein